MKHLHLRWTVASMLFVALSVGCTSEVADRGPAPATEEPAPAQELALMVPLELEMRADAYLAAWNSDDPEAVAHFFADDAMAMVQDSTYSGLSAIRQRWLTPTVHLVSNLQAAEDVVDQMDGHLVIAGSHSYTISLPDGTTQQVAGRNSTTWNRGADGLWRIRSTTFQDDA
ncbi:hypothetical protein BH23GEM6_BH23GEM6_06980 [soil metagenome]